MGTNDSDLAEDKNKPRIIIETINAQIVSKKYFEYILNANNEKIQIAETCTNQNAAYGSAENSRTVTTYYPDNQSVESGRIKSTLMPDKKLTSYTYEQGEYNAGQHSFTPGSGDYVKTLAVHGTETMPAGIANKTTSELHITDKLGNMVYQETSAYDGSNYHTIQWTEHEFDSFGRTIKTTSSNGTITENTWSCCGKESETNSTGITSSFIYDNLNRLTDKTTESAKGDIVTHYTYDASNRKLTSTVSSGGLSLLSSSLFDKAGRIISHTDNSKLTTTYSYQSGGSQTTIISSGGATEITTIYKDNRIKSITGSGVVPQFYEYGVNSDGSQWTKVYTGYENSPNWQKTTRDMAGRTLTTEKPGFTGTETTQYFYNTHSKLIKTTQPGIADTLYEYDILGNQVRTGLDVNHNGTLDLASLDRITENETYYTKPATDWFQESVQKIYVTDNDNTTTTISTQRSRLTGLGNGLISETISIDIHGNQTLSQTIINRAAKSITRTINYPDSTINAQTINIYGLVTSSKSKTGIVTTYEYDNLARRIGTIDPRTGKSTIHYDPVTGRVDYTEDPEGNQTSYTYNSAGQTATMVNPLGKTTRYAYTPSGQLEYTWGNATDPVSFEYNTYGQKTHMHTYRGGSNWNQQTWPAGATGTADTTTWNFHESTSLLISKEYSDNTATIYTYTTQGKILTRTWARTDNSNPIITTYTYNADTEALTQIDYSDSTPDINFTYNRSGQQKTITDAAGTRVFAYNNLQLETEIINGSGGGLYTKTITRTHDTQGRSTGFTTGSDSTTTYTYDPATGRFTSISWDTGSGVKTTTYSYENNSNLINQLTTANLTTNYTYEPKRNLKTRVQHNYNGSAFLQYDYTYNAAGMRENMQRTPTLANIIENSITTYTPNNLNQYTAITKNQTTINPEYDPDGNLTNDGNSQYTYNAENRLIIVEPVSPSPGDKKSEYAYDFLGRRINKTIYDYNTGSWNLEKEILFIYDG